MVRTLLTSIVAVALVAGCDNPESARVEETRTKLVGTWVREAVAGNEKLQETLALGADGKFTDHLVLTASDGGPETRTFGGEWSYDGINLKRRYLQENGRQYSGGGMRYATFPLVSVGASELVVDNTIEGQKVSYRKASQGSRP